jgi:hypothetical protein
MSTIYCLDYLAVDNINQHFNLLNSISIENIDNVILILSYNVYVNKKMCFKYYRKVDFSLF